MTARPPTPKNLGVHGKKLWMAIAPPAYELRPDELRVLVECCREVDIIERLEDALRGDDLLIESIRPGVTVSNPLVSELRQHRSTLTTMLKALQLPDSNAGSVQRAALISQQATQAARARWDRVRTGT